MAVLITGGAGYIGSHTALECLKDGREVVVVDNLANSREKSLERVQKLAGKGLKFYRGDVRDGALLDRIFAENDIGCVIHFAGLKAVGESVRIPVDYYDNNINSTLALIRAMQKCGTRNLVFSSSATVYGMENKVPFREDCRTGATNPYGRTKLFIEEILKDLHLSDPSFHISLLRYFNPVGADASGEIGEDPNGIPNNLMPFVAQVAIGKLAEIKVFGNDYPTPDGTGVRDYIHVTDLAKGHILAMNALETKGGVQVYNLGTGRGISVLEMIAAFSKACGRELPYKIVARREGDIAECYASTEKAKKELGFVAERGVDEMCRDLWNWQTKNPKGYRG